MIPVSTPAFETGALLLQITPSGESFLKLDILTAAHGRLIALLRRSAKKSASQPDLFEHLQLRLEPGQGGGVYFVKEYRLLNSYAAIAKNYSAFQRAGDWARLLTRNLPHDTPADSIFNLTTQALNAWADGSAPEATYFKTLYRFARDEGLAVKQHWWAELPRGARELAAVVLNHPLADLPCEDSEVTPLHQSLSRWLKGHAEWAV